jgi:hypothetical protein
MAHQIRHLIVAGVCLLLAPFALAQKAGPVVTSFTVFALRPIDGLEITGATGMREAVQFKASTRSPKYTVSGIGPLKFFDHTTGAVVAEATIPPEVRQPLLLFLDPPALNPRGLKHQIAVIDDSSAKLGSGQLAILNLSGLKFTGMLDKTALTVEPGLNAPVPFTQFARLTLYTLARGTKVQSYADVLKPSKTARVLLILFPPARKGALEVQVRALSEEPPLPASPITVPPMRK